MCTSVAINRGDFYFGRNMDIEGALGDGVVITPRSFPLCFRREMPSLSHYAMIGSAVMADGYPLYADGMNEKGLAMAGLNFPYNAYYGKTAEKEKAQIAPFEFIPWVLSRCANVREAKVLLQDAEIVSEPFSDAFPMTPLHWHIADGTGSLTVEPMKDGLRVYENPVGVLTNNPPFPRQLDQLGKYGNLSNICERGRTEDSAFSFGLGGVGLPGDYSSSSRFVKAAVMRKWMVLDGAEREAVCGFFSLLGSVAPPRGCVLNEAGRPHFTVYACCMNAARSAYYKRCAKDGKIRKFELTQSLCDGTVPLAPIAEENF